MVIAGKVWFSVLLQMLALTEDDLEKMKLTDGPRRKFMRQLEYLKSVCCICLPCTCSLCGVVCDSFIQFVFISIAF